MQLPLDFYFGRAQQRAAGFTLVELMVVVALLGVLLALAAPPFANALQRQRERSAAQELFDAMQLGRAEAMRLGRPVVLRRVEPCAANRVNGMWACGWRMFVDQNANNLADAGEPLLLEGGLNQRAWLWRSGLPALGPFIQLNAYGGVPVGLSVLAHAGNGAPAIGTPGVWVCTFGTRIRMVQGERC